MLKKNCLALSGNWRKIAAKGAAAALKWKSPLEKRKVSRFWIELKLLRGWVWSMESRLQQPVHLVARRPERERSRALLLLSARYKEWICAHGRKTFYFYEAAAGSPGNYYWPARDANASITAPVMICCRCLFRLRRAAHLKLSYNSKKASRFLFASHAPDKVKRPRGSFATQHLLAQHVYTPSAFGRKKTLALFEFPARNFSSFVTFPKVKVKKAVITW